MAHIWFRGDEGKWSFRVLDGEDVPLATAGDASKEAASRSALVREVAEAAGPAWVLLAGSRADVRANGEPLALGVRVLRDRDEIRVDGQGVYFFSAERIAEPAPFPGTAGASLCPRCGLDIERGSLAVSCPRCGVWHHQTDEYPCWTYADRCQVCPQETAMGPGSLWTPEED